MEGVLRRRRSCSTAPFARVWLVSLVVVVVWCCSRAVLVARAQPCQEFCTCNGTSSVTVVCIGQGFTTVPPVIFDGYRNTSIVVLGDNQIERLPSYHFFRLTLLRQLYLYENLISDIEPDAFRGLRNLELLSLYDNNITSLPMGIFEGLDSLRGLYLYRNRLAGAQITDELFAPIASTLRVLRLNLNNIEYLRPGTFASLQHLTTLGLSGNPLTTLETGVFRGLESLRILQLENCQIETLDEEAFFNLTQLRILRLNNNRLTRITNMNFLDLLQVQELYLQFNSISHIDGGTFFRMINLKRLFLQGNALTEFSRGMLRGPTRLEVLWLDRNRIENIPQDAFTDLKSLHQLFLQNNRIKTLSNCQFEGLDSLRILVLQFNQIGCIADGAFCCLPYLARLYLGANDLQMVTPRMFSCMAEVTRLSLFGNRISYVADGTFNSMTALRELIWDYTTSAPAPSLGAISNDLNCDCNALYFKGFIAQQPDRVDTVRCAGPAVLRTKLLHTIHQRTLNCTKQVVSVNIIIDDYKSPRAFRLPAPSSSPAAVERIVVPRGEDLHLLSKATPAGVTFWTRRGESLAADDCRTVTTQGNLFLSGMSDSLEGLYTLVVQNTAGATARSIFISVGDSPRITVAPRDVERDYPGENVMFMCVVQGKPQPDYYWMKDGRRINVTVPVPRTAIDSQTQRFIQTGSSLHILKTEYSDAGLYTCVAENGIGRGDRAEAELFFRRQTPCTPSCRNNGTCLTAHIFTCQCTFNYIGEVCERRKPGCDPAKDFGCEWESGSGASGDGALFTELDNAANGGDAADLEEQLSPAAP
ncbi:leucine-rich repeat-containing protein 15-like [Sycon ciliatum]|uniref:leucine-rich repeat-containing protein 15-like n=1 Tax=Sycon ciliatum TaxID=27933 RepID=UPI0031F6DD17